MAGIVKNISRYIRYKMFLWKVRSLRKMELELLSCKVVDSGYVMDDFAVVCAFCYSSCGQCGEGGTIDALQEEVDKKMSHYLDLELRIIERYHNELSCK